MSIANNISLKEGLFHDKSRMASMYSIQDQVTWWTSIYMTIEVACNGKIFKLSETDTLSTILRLRLIKTLFEIVCVSFSLSKVLIRYFWNCFGRQL